MTNLPLDKMAGFNAPLSGGFWAPHDNSEGMYSGIFPFAQRDVVDTFLAGVAPSERMFLSKLFEKNIEGIAKIIIENLPSESGLNDAEKEKLLKKASQASENLVKTFQEEFEKRLEERHINPFLEVLDFLPKQELADLAESLVSVTSVKRKVSLDIETVGGPIDVAVISKGDGFVWIKRKHYLIRS